MKIFKSNVFRAELMGVASRLRDLGGKIKHYKVGHSGNNLIDRVANPHLDDDPRPSSSSPIDDFNFRNPQNLSGDMGRQKILFVGSCLLGYWVDAIEENIPSIDATLFGVNNGAPLPDLDKVIIDEFDFQIVQVPLRQILPESLYFNIPAWDGASYDAAFKQACANLDYILDQNMKYNAEHHLLTFVLGYFVPQHKSLGRLSQKYHLSNFTYFIECINRHLYERIKDYANAFYIDMDELSANYGKKYVQEDSITHSNHGSIITSFEMLGDQNRLEPIGNMGELYQPKTLPFIITCIHEILSCYKSIRQQSAIKLVIFDIDDTLWRGVGAEMDDVDASMGEGWPLGIVEAASCLWKRGIMIAIVSKNDEENVKRMWTRIYGDRFNLENFVVKRINWRPKAENIEEIISLINVLPSSVLFVDDNPVERAAVKAVFPDIRTLDAPLVEWRRILLWSAETQPAVITSESLARTDMVKGQIEREKVRSEMTQGEFLKRLDIKISPLWIDSESHGKFERCFELLNKTNQFNSTGQRWSKADVMSYFAKSGVFIALEVRDRFTEYGLVALALVLDDEITQVVMSCRVIGLGVERALFSEIAARKMNFLGEIKALVRETGKNALIIDAFQRSGFERRGDVFIHFDKAALSAPDHVGVL